MTVTAKIVNWAIAYWTAAGNPLGPGVTPGRATETAWADGLAGLDDEQAAAAVRSLNRTSPDTWLTPSRIAAEAARLQAEAQARAPRCPAHPDQPEPPDCAWCHSERIADWDPPALTMLRPDDPGRTPDGLPDQSPGMIAWPGEETLSGMPPEQLAEIEARKRAVAAAARAAKELRPRRRAADAARRGASPVRDLEKRLGRRIAALEKRLPPAPDPDDPGPPEPPPPLDNPPEPANTDPQGNR